MYDRVRVFQLGAVNGGKKRNDSENFNHSLSNVDWVVNCMPSNTIISLVWDRPVAHARRDTPIIHTLPSHGWMLFFVVDRVVDGV